MEATIRSLHRNFTSKLEEPVRQHLKNVYGCLMLSTISASVGAYLHIFTVFTAGWLSVFGALGLIGLLMATPDNDKNRKLRLAYLLGFAFFSGMGMGPMLQVCITIDPSIIVTALLATTAIFASFSLSALFATRGYFLFLAGPLVTLLLATSVLSIVNIFFRSIMIFQINLYIGLLLMCGFVLFDTSVIIEKRRAGDKDFITHSIDLFIDFIGIFKRILIILAQKSEAEDRRRRRD